MTSTSVQSQPTQNQVSETPKYPRSPSIETAIRNSVLEVCQREHLSGSQFPLKEILVAPRLLARIRLPGPDDNPQYAPVLYQTLPNLYDSPDLAAGLPYPTISLDKALQIHSRISVCGYAGSGKTTMLADLASRICSRDSSATALNSFLPIYIHCRNLLFSSQVSGNVFFPLLRYLAVLAKIHDEKNLSSSILGAAAEDQLILFLDGLDELPPGTASKTLQWLSQLIKEFPTIKLVTTTFPFAANTQSNLGFFELAVAPWTGADITAFIDRFAQAWFSAYQQSEAASFIPKWLKTSPMPSHPLELTLACWSAFTGNSFSLHGEAAFTPYLSNVCSHPLATGTLTSIAAAEFASGFVGISQPELESLISSDPLIKSNARAELPGEASKPDTSRASLADITLRSLLNEYLAAGILAHTVQGRYFFKSDHLCAALYVQTDMPKIPNNWRVATQFSFIDSLLLFACSAGKINAQVTQWLNDLDFPLFHGIQIISHWLVAYPAMTRGMLVQAYKKVIVLIQKSTLPLSLQIKLLTPLLLSTEPATLSFFKELASSEISLHRQISAFCLSYYPSAIADPILLTLTSDPDVEVQKLACISLAKSWSGQAQKKLVNLVTSGVPEIRQIIGELFAHIPGDGPELLKELVVLPNNPEARKSAVDGLLLIGTDWSKALIKKANIEDTEWLVRDTAANAIKLNSVDHLFRPKRNLAPANLPWLIKFAASRRMGIYADEFPTDILIKAASEGDSSVQAAAFDTLASDTSAESIQFLKQAFLNSRGINQELAYSGLDALSRRGINLQK